MSSSVMSINSLQGVLTSHISISFGTLGALALVNRLKVLPKNYEHYIKISIIIYAISFALLGYIDYYDSYLRYLRDDEIKFTTWDKILAHIYMILGIMMISVIVILSIFILKKNN
jgi:ABC-type spermidine/putrescine transport system permease subunit II